MSNVKEMCYRILLLFCRLRFGESDRDIIWLKAIVLFTGLETAALIAVAVSTELLFGWSALAYVSKADVFVGYAVLFLLNHRVLFRESDGLQFEAKLRNELPQARRHKTIAAIMIVLVIVTSVVLSLNAIRRQRAAQQMSSAPAGSSRPK